MGVKRIPAKRIAVNTASVEHMLLTNLAKHLEIVTKRA